MHSRLPWSLFTVLALPILALPAARAFDIPAFDFGNNAPMPAAVVQLYTDLDGIAVGTAPTDAQHQAIVDDLDALAAGIFTPDPADVDQLATDLGTAATAGLFSDNVLEYLADDFIGAPGDPDTDPDGWMDDIQDDVASLIATPSPVLDPGDPTTFSPPLDGAVYVLANGAQVSGGSLTTRTSLSLVAQGIPQFLLENYSGQVKLITKTTSGGPAVDSLRLNTSGLPPTNPYTVSVTRRSDGASVVVGKLHVRGGPELVDFSLASSLVAKPQAELLSYGHAVYGGANAKKPLPSGFDASDVATVTLTDAQGVVRLTGSTAATQTRTLHLRLGGTAVTPAAAPFASVLARHRASVANPSDRFRFLARHLPSSAAVTLLADGVVVGQYTTSAHGQLFIVEGFSPTRLNRDGSSTSAYVLPAGTDLSGTKTFTLTDAQGTTLVTGSLD